VKEHNALPQLARDQLAREQRARADAHPDADLLSAFCECALNDAERSRVMDHISICGECREVVFLSAPDLAINVASPASVTPPVVNWWRRFLPVFTAAAAIIVVGSAVLLNRTNRTEAPSAKIAEAPQIEAPAAESNRPETSQAADAQIAEHEKELASKKLAITKNSDKLAANQQPSPLAGELAPKQKNDVRFDAPAVGGPLQQQLTASGAHGPLSPKGNATNYQNVAVTPTRTAPIAPTAAAKYGPVEAAGNASNYAYGIPGAKSEGVLGGVVAKARAPVTQAKAAPDKPASPPAVQSETVEVTAASSMVAAQMADSSAQLTQSGKSVGYSSLEKMPVDARQVRAHWRIADSGQLQRKLGNGAWASVLADANVKFRVLSVIGNDVWVAGTAGALYHSTDAGERWSKVPIPGMTETITEIRFHDANSGAVTTESGALWQTSDAGAHWMRK
jgi:hypothetical protein